MSKYELLEKIGFVDALLVKLMNLRVGSFRLASSYVAGRIRGRRFIYGNPRFSCGSPLWSGKNGHLRRRLLKRMLKEREKLIQGLAILDTESRMLDDFEQICVD